MIFFAALFPSNAMIRFSSLSNRVFDPDIIMHEQHAITVGNTIPTTTITIPTNALPNACCVGISILCFFFSQHHNSRDAKTTEKYGSGIEKKLADDDDELGEDDGLGVTDDDDDGDPSPNNRPISCLHIVTIIEHG